MAENQRVLASLWDLATAHRDSHNLVVRYRGHIAAHEAGLEGFFHPDEFNAGPEGRPVRSINLYRTPAPFPQNAPALEGIHVLHDVCTLAHEYGHFLSWRDRDQRDDWDAYFAAARVRDAGERALTAEEVRRILDEEQRAWRLGRAALAELAFQEWIEFDRREEIGLTNHRQRMLASQDR